MAWNACEDFDAHSINLYRRIVGIASFLTFADGACMEGAVWLSGRAVDLGQKEFAR